MGRTIKRLAGPAAVATGPATIYTVPALTTAMVDSIWINNPSASPVTVTVSIGADAAGTRILDAFSIPAKAAGVTSSTLVLYPRIPMSTTEVIQVAAGTNNILVIVVSGTENVAG